MSLKKGKPVCRVPWKRRTSNLPSKPSKKRTAQAQITPTISTKVDMTASTMKLEQAGHAISLGSQLAKAASCASRNARGLKSHPGVFYSYGVVSGLHYRTACLPKRRSCDGYFGCCDEHICSNTGRYHMPSTCKQLTLYLLALPHIFPISITTTITVIV